MNSNLEKKFDEIWDLAKQMGLDPFPVCFEEVPREIIWDTASYGLPTRMSHWSFGRTFLHQKISGEMGYGKIYELVVNSNPSVAFLDETNDDVANMLICAHVIAHSDFFKNNLLFHGTNRNMVNQAEDNAKRIDMFKDKYGIDVVEDWMDIAFSIDAHIDWKKGENRKKYPEPEHVFKTYKPLPYADLFGESDQPHVKEEIINKGFPPYKEKDLLWFLVNYAQMLPWQREVLSIIRSEMFYFYPYGQTQIANEGWACVASNTLVFTNNGLCPMKEVVENKISIVSDGEKQQHVYDQNIIKNHPTIKMKTKRGLEVTGSTTHRVLLADGTFKRLDEMKVGDIVKVSGGAGIWPKNEVKVSWSLPESISLEDVAEKAGVCIETIMRHRAGKRTEKVKKINAALIKYNSKENAYTLGVLMSKRCKVRIPKILDTKLASFLGYLIGDGNISRVGRYLGLTTGDLEQAKTFSKLVQDLFEIKTRMKRDEGRYRVFLYSETVSDYLTQAFGLTTGPSARQKTIPDVILHSPEHIVRAFLRAYFDCDGYAGEKGVILSTSSDSLAERTQVILLNWGILSRRNAQAHKIWNICIHGLSAAKFFKKIGFGLSRKQKALEKYIKNHQWFKKEHWTDEVIALEPGTADVYDISVRDTHQYAAAGFIHHNSFWHAEIINNYWNMTAAEHLDFAQTHSKIVRPGSGGTLNPYYVGFKIFGDIRKRWDKYYEEGQKDKAFLASNEIDHYNDKGEVVLSKMNGLQKILQVRIEEDDISLVSNYLTRKLCKDMELFVYGLENLYENPEEDDVILKDRELEAVKQTLVARKHNNGVPVIYIVKADERGLSLEHEKADPTPLDPLYAKKTLEYIYQVWKHPVFLKSRDFKNNEMVYEVNKQGVTETVTEPGATSKKFNI